MAKIDEHIKVMMLKGETGANIKSIDKTATSGLVDTYTVTLTDGSKSNFTVTNGKDGVDGKDGAGFDTFEIGGRNLLLKSGTFGDFENTADVTLSDGILSFGTSGTIAIEVPVQCSQSAYAFLHGQKVTVSFWVRVREGLSKVADATYFGALISGGYSDGTEFYFGAYPSLESEIATADSKWRKFSATYQLKDTEVVRMRAGFYKRGITGAVDYTRPKIEIGTKPSDWTPAPEDKADVSALAGKADVSAIVPKASVESSTTASQAYSAGQYVVVNGILRKVKSAIANGNTISDSNSTATTVGGELATLGESVSRESFEQNDVHAERFGKVVTLKIATNRVSISDGWGVAHVCVLPWQPTGEVVFAVTLQGGVSGVIGRVEKDGGLWIVGKDTEWRSGWLFGSVSYVCA